MKRTVLILMVTFCLVCAGSPFTGAAEKAPGTTKLDSISDKYEPVTFDHAKHTSLAGNCGACHHQHNNYAALPCKECHSVDASLFKKSVTNNFIACRNCHSTFDRTNPRMPGLKTAYHQQCFQCHRGMAEVGEGPAGCTAMCHAKKASAAR